jgi:hypothetical protein
MAEITPFANTTRIGVDNCIVDQRSIQNTQSCNYQLQNYFLAECGMKKPIEFATSQPAVNYKGSHNLGLGGCNVDANSELLLGSLQTHPKNKVEIYQRPYNTVPYLGRGSVDSVDESKLMQGEQVTNRRSVNRLSEKTYMSYTSTPLLSSINDRVTNPSYSVEEVASSNWVRGGIASRDVHRDTK